MTQAGQPTSPTATPPTSPTAQPAHEHSNPKGILPVLGHPLLLDHCLTIDCVWAWAWAKICIFRMNKAVASTQSPLLLNVGLAPALADVLDEHLQSEAAAAAANWCCSVQAGASKEARNIKTRCKYNRKKAAHPDSPTRTFYTY